MLKRTKTITFVEHSWDTLYICVHVDRHKGQVRNNAE